jgi:putative holliday junction resolvase
MDNTQSKTAPNSFLGIDFGSKKVGVATFRIGHTPMPMIWGNISYKSEQELFEKLQDVIDEEVVDTVVLGLPLQADGTEGKLSKRIRLFSDKIKQKCPDIKHHYFQDETLTSYEAECRMKNSPRFNFKVDKSLLDAVAASIILEDFVRDNLEIS